MMAERPIVVFGDIVDDVITTVAADVRRDTDTVADIVFTEGGSGANVAAWLGRLGAPVDFHGRVGRGDAARHRAALERFGVRALLREDAESPTARIVVLVEGDHRSFLTMSGASAKLGPDAIGDDDLRGAFALHATGHSLRDPERLAQFPALVARAAAAGVAVSLDPSSAGFIRDLVRALGAERFRAAIAGVDTLLPNLDEAVAMTGESDARRAAAALTELATTVVVTLGDAGALVATGGTITSVPAADAELVDPTGAGDAFAAGYLAARRSGRDPVDAAREASAVAARALSHRGGRPADTGIH